MNDNTLPYLRSQFDILISVSARVRDTEHERWSMPEKYAMLNEALEMWSDKVRVAHVYQFTDGFSSDTYEYTLPAYVRAPLRVQQQITLPLDLPIQVDDTTTYTWEDLIGWDVEPDGSGGATLRIAVSPFSLPGRVIWYAPNGRVPESIPATNADIDADDTSVVISSAVDVEDAGYIKIGAEWMAYAGVTYGASTTTLSNLLRGIAGTTAASHSSGASVEWGVAVHTLSLYGQLRNQIQALAHGRFLTDNPGTERGNHGQMLRFYQDQADKYWETYRQPIAPRMKLSRRGLIF